MAESLYDTDRQLRRAVASLERLPGLSARKKQLVLDFKDEMLANGISKGRVARFVYYLRKLGQWLDCEFEEADLAAIKRLVSRIEASHYVAFSKMELKLGVRRFYKWLRGTEEYPPEVKWIPMKVKPSERMKLPEELLTEKEVRALIQAALSPRDRAMIAVLYESGTRIGELALLRLKHVQFDTYGAQLLVHGKTGSRRVRIISSVPELTEWLNVHPHRDDPEAYLWVTNRGKPPQHHTITGTLASIAKRAGVKKRANPHAFRHARATHLACHLTEAQMKEYFGWVQASKMAAIYVHLSGRDVDDALLKLHGLKREDKTEEEGQLQPRTCVRCKTTNPATNRFCSLCGLPLDGEARTKLLQDDLGRREADRILDKMLEDPSFKRQFLSKVSEAVSAKGPKARPG